MSEESGVFAGTGDAAGLAASSETFPSTVYGFSAGGVGSGDWLILILTGAMVGRGVGRSKRDLPTSASSLLRNNIHPLRLLF